MTRPYLGKYNPLGQVKREEEIPREGLSKRLVEHEHLLELLYVDGVDVTVGEGPHVGGGLAEAGLLPHGVAEDVPTAQKGQDLAVLNGLG